MNQITEFKSFSQMLKALPDDKVCREYLEKVRWPDGTPTCPHCGTVDINHYKLKTKGEFKGLYKCKGCRERFTVTVGSMFEGSHIGLRNWFIAIYMFSSHKKGISSHQLARDLGITQKSSWFMLSRIRHAYDIKPDGNQGIGITQVDETFVGGKNKNRHGEKKIKNSQGRSLKDKTPVFGLLNNNKVNTYVVPNTKAVTLKPIIVDMVKKGSIIVSDEWGAYSSLKKDYIHEVVKHKDGVYMKNGFHTNGIENFWSLLKRGIFGIYHHASPKHLQKYCNEFAFRFNSREMGTGERFDVSLKIADNRLRYKDLINA